MSLRDFMKLLYPTLPQAAPAGRCKNDGSMLCTTCNGCVKCFTCVCGASTYSPGQFNPPPVPCVHGIIGACVQCSPGFMHPNRLYLTTAGILGPGGIYPPYDFPEDGDTPVEDALAILGDKLPALLDILGIDPSKASLPAKELMELILPAILKKYTQGELEPQTPEEIMVKNLVKEMQK